MRRSAERAARLSPAPLIDPRTLQVRALGPDLGAADTVRGVAQERPGVHVSAAPRAGWWPLLAYAFILVGAAIRFQQLFVRRSLWLDEALLANNIVGRGYGRLLEPLGGNQAAPPGFLWIERAAMSLFGTNEYALRLLPLAAGIALPWLIWLLARRVLTPVSAVVATGLVAFSP